MTKHSERACPAFKTSVGGQALMEGVMMRGPEKIACAVRKPDGTIYTVKPVCTHMGCILEWNQDECSWDCPCHGSRFTKNGRLIDNPATGNLKK